MVEKSMSGVNQNLARVAVIVAHVEKYKLYMGEYKSTVEWGMKRFEFKKSMMYSMISVGTSLLSVDESGTIESVLPHTVKDYTVSQLEKMLPMKNDISGLNSMSAANEINPDMTCKQIEAAIKSKIAESNEPEEAEETEPEEAEETEPEEAEETEPEEVKPDTAHMIQDTDTVYFGLILQEVKQNEVLFQKIALMVNERNDKIKSFERL